MLAVRGVADTWRQAVRMTTCPRCTSQNAVSKGKTPANKQARLDRACGERFVGGTQPSAKDETLKVTILKAMNERMELRAAQRAFGVHRDTISTWLNSRDVPG